MELHKTKQIVNNFIEAIWNEQLFDIADQYLHPKFTDHSLPSTLSPDKAGLIQWIKATSRSFQHKTIVEDLIAENDKVVLKISMELKHIGTWRDIEATEANISTAGYRFFRLEKEQLIEHWALIDGSHIENQLKNLQRGCSLR